MAYANPARFMQNLAKRNACGSFLLDLPAALWMLLMLLTFPLLDLATVSLRYTFLLTASRNAAHAAAEAKTFQTNSSSTDLSAINIANYQVSQTASQFSGITITAPVTVNIMITNIGSDTITVQNTPLTAPADTTNNLYSIQTRVTGNVWPLVTYNGPLLGHIPGLTGPMTVTVTSEEIAENPQGLNE